MFIFLIILNNKFNINNKPTYTTLVTLEYGNTNLNNVSAYRS